MNTISDQPMPISSRFAPVMLASTSEQLEAPSAPGALQLAPYCSTSLPPFQANTNPTAYSGRTAIRAKTTMARLGGTSSSAGSGAAPGTRAATARVSGTGPLRAAVAVGWGSAANGSSGSVGSRGGHQTAGRSRPPARRVRHRVGAGAHRPDGVLGGTAAP